MERELKLNRFMNDKQLQRVTQTQAKRLDKLGFDWETTHYYWWNGEIYELDNTLERINQNGVDTKFKRYSAPTVALALEWIRIEKMISCGVSFIIQYEGGSLGNSYKLYYFGKYADANSISKSNYKETMNYTTYPAADSALLDELLTLLEKEK